MFLLLSPPERHDIRAGKVVIIDECPLVGLVVAAMDACTAVVAACQFASVDAERSAGG
jgi:hypothetical protein